MVVVLFEDQFAPAAIQIEILAHPGRVERLQQLSRQGVFPAAAEFDRQVGVGIDHREARPLDQRLPGDESGCGFEVFKKHRFRFFFVSW
jgi:hypothetical protein